ncbi:MAG: hypothetical protein ACQGVC_18845 [Myxococcota bacterium]
MKPASPAWVLAAAALYVALGLGLAARHLDEPGLYYDEVIQAGPAVEFLRADGEPLRVPGARSVRAFGGWLPWMTQPYMGALKSLALVPVFALFEADAVVLRAATLLWALLAVPFAMLFANRLVGGAAALVAGALLAVDPSLLFLGRHDWGSFALGLLLRCAGLFAVLRGFQLPSTASVAVGGTCLGLGVYNKIDFGIFLAGAALALAVAAPAVLWRCLREERARIAAGAAGFALGALPLLLALGGALSVTGAAARGGSLAGDLAEKWSVLGTVLDGSHFQRLMLAGGRFEDLSQVAGAAGGPGAALVLAGLLAIGAFRLIPRLREAGDRGAGFLALATVLVLAGVLLTPRALRAHHYANVLPLPQLVVATAAVMLWQRADRVAAWAGRGMALLMVAGTLVASLRIDVATLATLRDTGGRGRWSHAVEELARELPADTRVVSLDWGFDGPVRFVAPDLATDEPIWRLRRGGAAARLAGGPRDLYLVHEPRFAVMPFGDALLAALEDLPDGAARVRVHGDRAGEPVLRSVRFTRPHVLTYRSGRFSVEWR